MSRARDVASLLNTVATDTEVSDAIAAVPTVRKNLLYNGAMQVAQRGTSTASITTTGYYTADRWGAVIGFLGTWTQSIETDAPFASAGLSKSLKMLCTTADAAPAANDSLAMSQTLEGQDLQRIRKGSSAAQQLTLSFWAKSNVTGTYIVELVDSDNTRRVSSSYSVDASATWEKKTITFPADTTGGFDNDNGPSLTIRWWLGAGSSFTSGTLGTTWHNTTADRAVGQTNLAANTNNYWQITGVQLEVGDTATDFEHKPYGVELAECQRYYWTTKGQTINIGGLSTGSGQYIRGHFTFPVQMRATPTITADWDAGNSNTPAVGHNGPNSVGFVFTSTGSNINSFEQASASGDGITASAEL